MEEANIKDQELIEDKLIDSISPLTRLIAFRPKEKIQGVNLIVKKRSEYEVAAGKQARTTMRGFTFSAPQTKKAEEILLQIHFKSGFEENDEYVKEIPAENLNPGADFFIVFICFDEVNETLGKYMWVIPSLDFVNIAEERKDGNKVFFKFKTPLDIKKIGKYSPYVVDKNHFGDLLFKILQAKGKFKFSGAGYIEETVVNLDNLRAFIAEARKNTYANSLKPTDNPRLFKSVQLEFQKGDYFYRDVYFSGQNNFIGQEIVYYSDKPAWGMNYIGKPFDKERDKYATPFLKEALRGLSEVCRFEKKCDFHKHEFDYRCQGQGSLENFSGEEEIFQSAKSIYKLSYQGGLI